MPPENETKIEDTAQTVDESKTEEEAKAAEDATADEPKEPAGDDDWSEEDLRLLSDEERAALFDDDEDGDNDTEGQEGDADAADEGNSEGQPADQEASNDDAPDDAADITGTQGTDLASLDAELEALEAAKVAAFDAWEDGDMTREEYLEKVKEIDTTTKDTVSKRAVAESQEQALITSFINTAGVYFNENPDLATEEHKYAFDRHVRAVTGSAQYQHMTHRQMLEAAHKLYAAEADVLGIDVPAFKAAKAKAAPVPDDPKVETPKKRARPGDKAPRTLANVPNAASVSVSDGKYSSIAQKLENADAAEYERIFGSMSPDEVEAFASMDV